MPPKKGKKKGGKKQQSAEEVRLQLLRVQEGEAEEFQKRENDRRDREEQEERLILWKEEHVRIIREKDGKVKELMSKVEQLTTSLRDERVASETQVEQLVVMRDSLLNEVSLLKAEADEKQRLFLQERHNAILKLEHVRTEADENIRALEEQMDQISTTLATTKLEFTEYQEKMESTVDEKESEIREQLLSIGKLQRELEKALAMNRSLQEVVECRETDDRKNVTLMQLLNAQLEENKRRYEDQLEEERRHATLAKEEALKLETRVAQLLDEIDALKRENTDIKMGTDVVLRDYKQQLEQVRHDSEYVASEIQAIREENLKERETTENVKTTLTEELQKTLIELETHQNKMGALESLLRRKERENFDKITFLNAQISNNRTVISQLQQKLLLERQVHETEITKTQENTKEKFRELEEVRQTFTESQDGAKEREAQLLSEVALLKSTHFQLQVALQEQQKCLDVVTSAKDEEIKRLCNLLDAHFIPHRKNVEGASSTHEGTIAIMADKIAALMREIEIRDQVALENETQLKARIANQDEIIEVLQDDLRASEARRREEVRCVEDEVSRLKKTLEIHFIPYSM